MRIGAVVDSFRVHILYNQVLEYFLFLFKKYLKQYNVVYDLSYVYWINKLTIESSKKF